LSKISPGHVTEAARARIREKAGLDGNGETELARLLRAALAGDERAYTEFLRRAACIVRGFARRRVAERGIDAEDIVQETLLAIHMKRHTWREDAPVTPWLYAIARYKLIDALRRRGRRVEIEIGEITETFAAPEPETVSDREGGRGTGGGGHRGHLLRRPVHGRFPAFCRHLVHDRDRRACPPWSRRRRSICPLVAFLA
jgi:RNA polymerase sigma-70 factor (ECF subfamily)